MREKNEQRNDAPLPDNWVVKTSRKRPANPYYFNTVTKRVSAIHPTVDPSPSPEPIAAPILSSLRLPVLLDGQDSRVSGPVTSSAPPQNRNGPSTHDDQSRTRPSEEPRLQPGPDQVAFDRAGARPDFDRRSGPDRSHSLDNRRRDDADRWSSDRDRERNGSKRIRLDNDRTKDQQLPLRSSDSHSVGLDRPERQSPAISRSLGRPDEGFARRVDASNSTFWVKPSIFALFLSAHVGCWTTRQANSCFSNA